MVEFEDMSYETLKRAIKKKFDVKLPKQEKLNQLSDLRHLTKHNTWEEFYLFDDENTIIERVKFKYNQSDLDNVVYVVLVKDELGNQCEIIKHKSGKKFSLTKYFEEVE